ncbi:hypothetical protein N657DRAFT_481359 [Parathielavia appendiculata]|uniref:Uncharacterized protein n=1 Tax=Parathielavia appendiculata TaxID=2587402 RepID=A0AAN6TYW5_9PEZI|nr:hypothetical protein N657DRAFT_481359 [Parathielavia appendiculata]
MTSDLFTLVGRSQRIGRMLRLGLLVHRRLADDDAGNRPGRRMPPRTFGRCLGAGFSIFFSSRVLHDVNPAPCQRVPLSLHDTFLVRIGWRKQRNLCQQTLDPYLLMHASFRSETNHFLAFGPRRSSRHDTTTTCAIPSDGPPRNGGTTRSLQAANEFLRLGKHTAALTQRCRSQPRLSHQTYLSMSWAPYVRLTFGSGPSLRGLTSPVAVGDECDRTSYLPTGEKAHDTHPCEGAYVEKACLSTSSSHNR